MKIYKVKVNGKVYEVELEAVSESNETFQTNYSIIKKHDSFYI